MDIFSLFHHAHQVYGKLQEMYPKVDISLPALTSESPDLDLNVVLKKEELVQKVDLKPDTPYQKFKQLPEIIRGAQEEITTLLRTYVKNVGALPVTLYREYSQALSSVFLPGAGSVVPAICQVFEEVASPYFQGESMTKEVKIKVSYPAKISVYCKVHNAAMVYCFCDKSLVFSGFAKPELVGTDVSFPLPVKETKVIETAITEANLVLLRFPTCRKTVLLEREFIYQETADDMLDTVIQKLILLDVLDALQEVIISDSGGLFLCFDPVLDLDEMETILLHLKEGYPQAQMSDQPSEESPWWIIEIPKVGDTAVQVSSAGVEPGTMSPGGVIMKPDDRTVASIAKDVDVGNVLTSLEK